MIKIIVLLTLICGVNVFAGGDQGGGGGSVIQVGPNQYDLSDLHFVHTPGEKLNFDKALTKELQADKQALLKLGLVIRHTTLKPIYASYDPNYIVGHEVVTTSEFFANQIFGDLVDYSFVQSLPKNCDYIPVENLPYNSNPFSIACTQGSVTYILPQYFKALSLIQQADLIIHERLHAWDRAEAFEVKTDVVRALYILRSKVQKAVDEQNWNFTLNRDDLDTLNRLARRVAQLGGAPAGGTESDIQQTQVVFMQTGGALIGAMNIQTTSAHFGAGSVFWAVQGADTVISAKNLNVMNSTLMGSIAGENITITNSDVYLSISAASTDVKIEGCQYSGSRNIFSPFSSGPDPIKIDGQSIYLKNTKFESAGTIVVVGRNISIENSTFSSAHLHGNQISIVGSKIDWTKLDGNNLSIHDSTISLIDIKASKGLVLNNTALQEAANDNRCTETEIEFQGDMQFNGVSMSVFPKLIFTAQMSGQQINGGSYHYSPSWFCSTKKISTLKDLESIKTK